MNILTWIILIFSLLGALDRIFNNRFGIGKEFEKGFYLFGDMALSMIGMIVIAPFIADILTPVFDFVSNVLHIDSSIIPASLFANDMGGATLAVQVTNNEHLGLFNALVVSSMMGCTISFTIPVALGMVDNKQHKELLLGLLCGITTIPAGCIVAGLMCKIPFEHFIINMLPLVLFSVLIAIGLVRFPTACVKIFSWFGYFIKVIITIGLALGIVRFLSGFQLIGGLEKLDEGARICLNASIVMTGAFPFMFILSKILRKPLELIGSKTGLNSESVLGIFSSIATSATAFGMMDKMDKKGIVLNSAFAVSGAFTLGSHLAFTMAFDNTYLLPVIIGKLVAGVTSLIVASLVFKKSVDKS